MQVLHFRYLCPDCTEESRCETSGANRYSGLLRYGSVTSIGQASGGWLSDVSYYLAAAA